MSLTTCMKKAGAHLHPDDKAAILKGSRTYRGQGMSADEAGRKAVGDQHAVVTELLRKMGVGEPAPEANRTTESDLGPETFAGSIKSEIERREQDAQRLQARRKKAVAETPTQPEPVDNETYRVKSDGKGEFVLESEDSIVGGGGDGSPRRFNSDTEARAWANQNGITVEQKPAHLQTEAEYGEQQRAQTVDMLERQLKAAKAGELRTGAFTGYKSKADAVRQLTAQLEQARVDKPERFASNHLADINRAIEAGEMPSAENIKRYEISPTQISIMQARLRGQQMTERAQKRFNRLSDMQAEAKRKGEKFDRDAAMKQLDAEGLSIQAPAEAAPVAATEATHTDPGAKPEPATAPVVAASLEKAATAEQRKPSEMKADLLKQIDEAIAKANNDPDDERALALAHYEATLPSKDEARDYLVKRMGGKGTIDDARTKLHNERVQSQQSHAAEVADRVGHVTFDVPGDGEFKIVNSKARLEEFRKRVESSPGFKDNPRSGPPVQAAPASAGTVAAIGNMIDEGDYQAATDYAAAKGANLDDLKLSKLDRAKLEAWQKANPQGATEAPAEAPAAEPTPQPAEKPAEAASEPAKTAATLTKESVKAEAERIEAQHDLRVLNLTLNANGDLSLDMIATLANKRGQGVGSAAMRDLTEFADKNGARIVLNPAQKGDPNGTTSRSRLVAFYKQFGFVENRGKNKDFAISDGMYRNPRDNGNTAMYSIANDADQADTASYGQATQAHIDLADKFQSIVNGRHPGTVFHAVAAGPADGRAGESVSSQSRAAVATVAKRLFGHEVVFVKFDGTPRFNGAMSESIPGVIFIRADSPRPLMAVLGHELLHQLAATNPTTYQILSNRLATVLKNQGQFGEQLRARYAAQGMTTDKVKFGEELHADIVGDNFMDPAFWQMMAKDQPGGFRRVANVILKFLDGVIAKMTGTRPFGTERFLTDIHAARTAVADAMRQLSGTQVGAMTGQHEGVNLSLADTLNEGLNSARDVNLPAGYKLGDLFNAANAPGKLGWWHKTLGTMHNLAERSPQFKRVYDATQHFLNDVSYYATEAANEAPNLLPKLESWKDITKTPISATDTKALRGPVFEGTLTWARDERGNAVKVADLEARAADVSPQDKAREMLRRGMVSENVLKMWQGLPVDQYEAAVNTRYANQALKPGVVWTDAELKSQFGLNDQQIPLYHEFRNAIDKSLTNLASSDMVRFGGKDIEPDVRQKALDAGDVDKAAVLLRDHLYAAAEAQPDRADVLNDTAEKMIEKAERARDLMKRGYAPLSRFGQYTLDVVGKDGTRDYFGMFESATERSKMERQMRANFPDATIEQGTVSQEAYKLFAGVSPETLELFGDMLGLEAQGSDASSQAFQTYLKVAKANRSAMKRLIERKGIAGFSEDAGRVLAGFVYSNARQNSSNLHMGEMTDATVDIPQRQGQLRDQATRLIDYVKTPQEEAQALRGLLFTQYLGGSVASAMVNALQPMQITFPYLSQYGGAVQAGKQMIAATRDALRNVTGDKVLDAALKKAEEDGIVSPQEVFQLMGQAQGKGALRSGDGTRMGDLAAKGSNFLSKTMLAWGKVFGVAEQFNRRVTFIAAYRTAVERGMPDPAKFAAHAVAETQFTFNKGCVDEATECLTASGWKKHAELVPGEVLYAVDPKTNALVESRLIDVHRYTDGNYDATEFMNSYGFSMILTPEHRCLIQNSSRGNKLQAPRLVRVDQIKIGDFFVRSPQKDATGRTPVYTDDEVRLFAWVAAEGCLFAHRGCVGKRGVNLSQSISKNPHYVAEIDDLLARLGGHHSRHVIKGGEMVSWTLRKPLWSKIHEALPGKMITFGLVKKLTVPQLAIFMHVFTQGDGHFPDEGGPIITQKDVGNLNALQAMAVMTGKTSTIYERMGKHPFGVLAIAKNTKRTQRNALTVRPVKLDMVWCPQTEHETWIARRNGRTFVTGNSKPVWARGAVGGTLFTFRQFAINNVELMHRLWTRGGAEGKRAALLQLGVLFLMSGAGGLPGLGNIDDIIDGLMQRLGYNFNSKAARAKFFAETLGMGADGARFVEHGVSGLPGAPIDVSGRLGLGNLVPGTGFFPKKQDYSRDAASLLGPAGDFAKRVFQGGNQIIASAVTGDVGGIAKGVVQMSPTAVQNAAKAYDMASTGMYKDQGGKKVIDTDAYDAAAKAIGFQPNNVAQVQSADSRIINMVALNRMREKEISGEWAQAIFAKDADGISAAQKDLASWNAANPESPIRITRNQIMSQVRQMNMSKDQRLQKSSPKEIRAEVSRQLASAQ